MTPGWFFTLLLYPPTHCVILRHVMIFINIGLLKFIIIDGTAILVNLAKFAKHVNVLAHAQ